jgi:hypothetical protein
MVLSASLRFGGHRKRLDRSRPTSMSPLIEASLEARNKRCSGKRNGVTDLSEFMCLTLTANKRSIYGQSRAAYLGPTFCLQLYRSLTAAMTESNKLDSSIESPLPEHICRFLLISPGEPLQLAPPHCRQSHSYTIQTSRSTRV